MLVNVPRHSNNVIISDGSDTDDTTLQYTVQIAPPIQEKFHLPAEIITSQLQDYSLVSILKTHCPDEQETKHLLKEFTSCKFQDEDDVYTNLEKIIRDYHFWCYRV